jgi:two-component system, cell cycle sensor histidine kinase and response regulator CckA
MTELNPQKNRRVLVIDDNRAIHDDFRKILCLAPGASAALDASEAALFGDVLETVTQTQFEMDSAYQGHEGVMLATKALSAGRPYAMAFVDVRMPPGWDGVETTGKLWELDPNLQVVLCTAYSDYSWEEMFAELGQRDGLLILKKPFDSVEAFQLAHALTEKWWLHQESRRKMEELESEVAGRTQELAKSISLLNATLESTTDSIVAVDLSGKVVSHNSRFTGTWQFPPQMLARADAAEMRAHTAEQVKDPARFLQRIQELQADPNADGFDVIELKDGRTFERYVFPQRINHKRMGTVISWRDITERKRAEDALRESNEKFRQLADNITDAFWIRSPDMREVHYVSPAFERIWGRSVASLYANPQQWTDFIFPEDRERVVAAFVALTGDVPRLEIEYRIVRPDGELRWIRVRGFQVRDAAHILIRHIGIVTDITERRGMEDQLFQSQKMETVGKLAGGIAHEFNSIMTAIIGQSELLLHDLSPGNPSCENAIEIRKAAERAATLTRQLLAYGRKQILRPEVLDLNAVLSSMEGMVRHLMGGVSNVRIVPAADLKSVKADAGQIEQVIMNIVMNAADAMPNGGKVTLETCNATLDQHYVSGFPDLNAGEYVLLAITDSGAGMTEAVKARVFEPFFTTKEVGKGTGLGLATCHGIIKQSGGHVAVYSEPGRGTTFKIYLPQAERITNVVAPLAESTSLPRGIETILLVEDDPALREMAATLLRRLGYKVLAAGNGIEALTLAHQPGTGHLDLLFTDVVMPHMSGKELAERIQLLFSGTKILFTSAYAEGAIVHQGTLNPKMELLQKPFTPAALAQKIREILNVNKTP